MGGFADFGVLIDDLADRVEGVDGDASQESVLDGLTDFGGVLSVDLVVDRVDRMEGDDTTSFVVAGSSLLLSSSSSFLSDVVGPLPVRRYNLSRSLLPRLFDAMVDGLTETERAVVFGCETLEEETEEVVVSVTVVELDRGDFLSLFFVVFVLFFDFLVGLLLLLRSVALTSEVRSMVRSNDFATDSRTADCRLRRSLSSSSNSFRLFRADCGVE